LNKIVEEDLECIASSKLPWEMLEGKEILISGINGFIPSYLAKVILYLNEHKFKKKSNVYGIARQARENVFEKNENLRIWECDICNITGLYLPKMDYIIHAAGKSSPKYTKSDILNVVLPNVIGTYNLLELAKQTNFEGFLFLSSGAVYSNFDSLNIRSSYSEAKRMGENLCISYMHQHNIPVKIARLFHVYGPNMDLNDGKMISDFVSDILNKKDISIKSRGTGVRTLCYISDAISALYTILLNGKAGEAYDIGNENAKVSVFELAKLLCNLYPDLHLTPSFAIPTPNESTIQRGVEVEIPDTNNLQALGWQPKHLLKSGLIRTIESYQ